MENKLAIKETREMLEAILELSLCLIDVFKDGAQISDIAELWSKLSNDPVVKAKMLAAYDGYRLIPAELKDMDAVEGVEIASALLLYIPRFIERLKRDASAS